MKSQRGFGAGLTVTQSGELFAVAKEKFDLEARSVELYWDYAGVKKRNKMLVL